MSDKPTEAPKPKYAAERTEGMALPRTHVFGKGIYETKDYDHGYYRAGGHEHLKTHGFPT